MDELVIQNFSDVSASVSATSGLATIESFLVKQRGDKKPITQTSNITIFPETVDELRVKNTKSFQCLSQIHLSRSSVLEHCLYEFPPLFDPGVADSFDVNRNEIEYDSTQTQSIYSVKCKDLGIPIIQRVLTSLNASILDLRYFGLNLKQIKAITAALTLNECVQEFILEENYLTAEGVFHISEMLRDNNYIQYLNLSRCDMGFKCCNELVEGISTTQSVLELDLSRNNMGNDAFRLLLNSLRDNSSIVRLNLSHNSLNGEVAEAFGLALAENEYLKDLDLSWNCFSNRKAVYWICKGLIAADRVIVLNLSWNGIKDVDAFYPLQRYLFRTTKLQHLDISNNYMQGPVLKMVKRSILGNSSLISVNVSSNLISPDEAYDLAQVFVTKTRKALKLQYLDMDNIVVNKNFVPFWEMVTAAGKHIRVEYVLGNYEIVGPNVVKVLFDRLRFITNKRKSRSSNKEFGHFLHNLGVNFITKSDFLNEIKSSRLPKLNQQQNLLKEIIKKYPAKNDKVDINRMKQDYYDLYPNTTVPTKKAKAKHPKDTKRKASAQDLTTSKLNLRWKGKLEDDIRSQLGEAHSHSALQEDGDGLLITKDQKDEILYRRESQLLNSVSSALLKKPSYYNEFMMRKNAGILDHIDSSETISTEVQRASLMENIIELQNNRLI